MVKQQLITDSSIPVFQFDVDKNILNNAFAGAIQLKITDESADKQSHKLIVANKNSYGKDIETTLDFISTSIAHLINPEIKKVANYVESKCKEISNEFYSLDIGYNTRNCSILFYKKGNKISKHFHFPYAFVCAIYIQVEENCSPIILGDNYKVQPRNGLGLIFPGHLMHSVSETISDRIMMTMDLEAITYE